MMRPTVIQRRTVVAFLSILIVTHAVNAQVPQFVTNGGFEDAIDFNSWTVEHAFTGSSLVCDSNPATAHGGQRSAHFGAHEGQPDVLNKHLATTNGLTYRISFWLSSDNIAPIYDSFVVVWGNQVLLNLSNPQNGFPYTYYAFDVVASGPSTELAFLGYKRFGSFRLDDVGVTIAPASDDCAAAPLILPNLTYYGDTNSATNSVNASCGLVLGPDVWYRIIPPCNTTLTMDTCGSDFDTTLSLWQGACGSLTEVACNDDNGGQGPCSGGYSSYVSVAVSANTQYYIRIAGYSLFTHGNYVFHISMPLPENDACSGAQPVTIGESVIGNTTCAVTDVVGSCGLGGAKDLWYSYVPSCNHNLRLDTCGSAIDTVLSVYTGDCQVLTELFCNDDHHRSEGEGGCVETLSSVLEFPVAAGEEYLIRVARYGGFAQDGEFVLNVASLDPIYDDCANAMPVGEGDSAFESRCAAGANGRFCNEPPNTRPGVWFAYTASCTGVVTVDICDPEGTSNALLSAFDGNCGALNCVASRQLSGMAVCPLSTEALSINAFAGVTYYICYTQQAGDPFRSGVISISIEHPANDLCDEAITVADGAYYGNTACASPDSASVCGLSFASNDVWYRWTAVCDGQLIADTCGSAYDTVLTVFRGECDSLVEVACNDDYPFNCAESNLLSRVDVPVLAGEELLIRVSGYNSSAGAFALNVVGISTNNFTCIDATPFVDNMATFDGACASGTGGRFGNTPIDGPAVWFTYTAECGGSKTIGFCRTAGPPRGLFSVYSGDCNNLVTIASRNVTSIPQFCPSGVNVLTFNSVAGATYRICYTQFAGTPLGAGNMWITEIPPPFDNCGTPAPLLLGENLGSTGCATPDGTAQCYPDAPDVWYSFTPPTAARLTLDTCGSAIDTVLSVFSGTCGDLALFACSDDADGYGGCQQANASYVSMNVEGGTQYRIRVGSQSGEDGSFVLQASLSAINDDCADAVLVGIDDTIVGDLSLATNDGVSGCSSTSGDRDVWYRWIPSNCSHHLILDTCGSSIDTVLSVFIGGCGKMTEIACSDDTGDGPCSGAGGSAYLNVPVSPGSQYWIRVAGANGASGPFTLHVNDAPRNDSCATPLPIGNGTTAFNGQCGSVDHSGAPVSCGRPNQPTLWFSYVAPCTGIITVDLCGSNYDTVASVHQGACDDLTELACNDNAGAELCPDNRFNSYVVFPGVAGMEYLIRVSSFDDETSDGLLTISCTPVDPPFSLGDMNCDGQVNNFDIDPFVTALTSPAIYAAQYPDCNPLNGDVNQDGTLNNFDIDPFVALITGG